MSKKDLKFVYQWPIQTIYDPTELDHDIIVLSNGNDVLNFINGFSKAHNLSSKKTLEKVEYILNKHLYPGINTRKEIENWICKNWNSIEPENDKGDINLFPYGQAE
ncbi:hypothetical protein [Mucilaginibacter polytrichastri]|uniref:Uncharacterized protein n=1 Tax=Mucilaginibacter polytrichastri TaxID=1302689 RepID=A0A1Q5ZVB3_9SPHI|nr:hypothetical protein [Mucilaginibacter polytrichastri]OKS85711.1 hypothetical protein RG47T_1157 [Mucilaginibacter polytrichastri]